MKKKEQKRLINEHTLDMMLVQTRNVSKVFKVDDCLKKVLCKTFGNHLQRKHKEKLTKDPQFSNSFNIAYSSYEMICLILSGRRFVQLCPEKLVFR